MRIDQDIHFQIGGVPVLMKLDTTAPFNGWILTPERKEDEQDAFAKAIHSAVVPHFADGAVFVSNDHATVVDSEEDGASIACNIFASLPEWDGESLDGLIGAEELANFLQYIKDCVEVDMFQRSDGRSIEFEDFALD